MNTTHSLNTILIDIVKNLKKDEVKIAEMSSKVGLNFSIESNKAIIYGNFFLKIIPVLNSKLRVSFSSIIVYSEKQCEKIFFSKNSYLILGKVILKY